jgi:hypothetical protein
MITERLKLTSLSSSVLDIPRKKERKKECSVFLHGKVLAALTSEAVQVITLLGAVALCYSII